MPFCDSSRTWRARAAGVHILRRGLHHGVRRHHRVRRPHGVHHLRRRPCAASPKVSVTGCGFESGGDDALFAHSERARWPPVRSIAASVRGRLGYHHLPGAFLSFKQQAGSTRRRHAGSVSPGGMPYAGACMYMGCWPGAMYIVCGIAMGMPPCIGTLCIGAAPAAQPARTASDGPYFTEQEGQALNPALCEASSRLNLCRCLKLQQVGTQLG